MRIPISDAHTRRFPPAHSRWWTTTAVSKRPATEGHKLALSVSEFVDVECRNALIKDSPYARHPPSPR